MRTIKLINTAFFVNPAYPDLLLGGTELAFRQGDLDGACGPYAAMTALVAAGLLTRQEAIEIWAKSPDRRTNFARAIDGLPTLVQDGIGGDQLKKLIQGVLKQVRGKNIYTLRDSLNEDAEVPVTIGRSLITLVKSALDDSEMPVILKLDWQGGGAHWVVVIGYEADEDGRVTHFLVLDPGFEVTRTQIWNGLLSAQPTKRGPYPYPYWCGNAGKHDRYCLITRAIFLS
jgi:hypothetical protein